MAEENARQSGKRRSDRDGNPDRGSVSEESESELFQECSEVKLESRKEKVCAVLLHRGGCVGE